jgi:DNA-binding transcriptional ArsR family regulator
MVDRSTARLDRTFRALSDPTRREILRRLTVREHTVGELAEPFNISLAAVSKHIKALESARLLSRRLEGREHYCRLSPTALNEAMDWLRFYEKFWAGGLARLETHLQRTKKATRGAP